MDEEEAVAGMDVRLGVACGSVAEVAGAGTEDGLFADEPPLAEETTAAFSTPLPCTTPVTIQEHMHATCSNTFTTTHITVCDTCG